MHIIEDNRKVLYVFARMALRLSLSRYVLSKVQRWEIHVSRFDLELEHIDRLRSIFTNLLTKWSKAYRLGKTMRESIAPLYKCIVPSTETTW